MKKAILLSVLLGVTGICSCLKVLDSDEFKVGDGGSVDSESDSGGGGDSDSDSDSEIEGWVGMPCDPADPDYCVGISGDLGAFCLAWEGEPKGFCTVDCEPATTENPVDGCDEEGTVCSDITQIAPEYPGVGICLQECVPESKANPCRADFIACDPQSWAWESQFATCFLPACLSDADCTAPIQGTCNEATGRCGWQGTADAEIGDPCESASDCGSNMVCLSEAVEDGGRVVAQNGYCTRTGCKAANYSSENGSGSSELGIQDEFGCGLEGVCHSAFSYGGYCLRACDPKNEDTDFSCRQAVWDSDVQDQNGDYECQDQRAWGFAINADENGAAYEIAKSPFCIWVSSGSGTKCVDGQVENAPEGETCESIFGRDGAGTSYGLGMACRNPATGEEDPDGYCLDDTTSGPTMVW